jgi:type IV pilus assembly protein PilB
MEKNNLDIKKILLKGGYVSEQDFNNAVDYASSHHSTVIEYLFSQNIITKTLFGQAVAEYFSLPFVDLSVEMPIKELVVKIPKDIADSLRILILKQTANELVIVTDSPEQKDLDKNIKKLFPNLKYKLAYSLPEDITQAFIFYEQSLEARFIKIITEEKKVAPSILEEVIKDALFYRASDVHFEPREGNVYTRFRIDGVLQEVGSFPHTFYENVLNRIKVQANMRIDDHFTAQDGAIRFSLQKEVVDARISIVPTLNGEKVVMRLLSEHAKSLNLTELGLSEYNYNLLTTAAKKPFGMILVTGPTGSGKTTTLYGLLKILNQPEINIMTIEDPIEYRVLTINQIQVNNATNLTFAKGLRSIVRQDPDIILVGEIRDKETAEVAINAALTGHLLLSTFHANNAASAIPRLLDMGVEPYLAASTIELILAQRLLRRICENCKFSSEISIEEIKKIIPKPEQYFTKTNTLYSGKGCTACHFTGYKGRVAIYEVIPVSQNLKDLIVRIPSADEVWQMAKKEGVKTMFEDGLLKVKSGLSTLAELNRVVPVNG